MLGETPVFIDEPPPPLPLDGLPRELLLRVLSAADAATVAKAACLSSRLRSAQLELAAQPSFASCLVRLPEAVAAAGPDGVADACVAALSHARRRLSGPPHFALLFVTPQPPPRRRAAGAAAAAAEDAATTAVAALLPHLPPGCSVLCATGNAVSGPEEKEERDGTNTLSPVETGRAVVLLLGRLPGCGVAVSSSEYPPDLPHRVAPSCPAVLAWLNAPAAGATPVACALFLRPSGQPARLPFSGTPHVARVSRPKRACRRMLSN